MKPSFRRWARIYWQFFAAASISRPGLPCDPSGLTLPSCAGDAGVEKLLAKTIGPRGVAEGHRPKDLERVIVDSTVGEGHRVSTDSRLLDVARRKLVLMAKRAGGAATDLREGRPQPQAAGRRLRHAKQYRRLRKVLNASGRSWAGSCVTWSVACRSLPTASRRSPPLGSGGPPHSHPAAQGQEQALCPARAGSRVHWQGKARQPYRIRGQGGYRHHRKRQPDRRRPGLSGNPYDGHTLAGADRGRRRS